MAVRLTLHDSLVNFNGVIKKIKINEKGNIEKIKVEFKKELNDDKKICPLVYTYSTNKTASSKNRFAYLFLSIEENR
jgi:hypothetical protein